MLRLNKFYSILNPVKILSKKRVAPHRLIQVKKILSRKRGDWVVKGSLKLIYSLYTQKEGKRGRELGCDLKPHILLVLLRD